MAGAVARLEPPCTARVTPAASASSASDARDTRRLEAPLLRHPPPQPSHARRLSSSPRPRAPPRPHTTRVACARRRGRGAAARRPAPDRVILKMPPRRLHTRRWGRRASQLHASVLSPASRDAMRRRRVVAAGAATAASPALKAGGGGCVLGELRERLCPAAGAATSRRAAGAASLHGEGVARATPSCQCKSPSCHGGCKSPSCHGGGSVCAAPFSPGETPGRVLWGVSQGCCRSLGGQHVQGGIAWVYPSPTRNEARDWRQRRPPPTQSGRPMPGTAGAAAPAGLTVSAAHTPAPACGPGRGSGGVGVYPAPWPQPATDVLSHSRTPPLPLPPVAAMTRPAPPSCAARDGGVSCHVGQEGGHLAPVEVPAVVHVHDVEPAPPDTRPRVSPAAPHTGRRACRNPHTSRANGPAHPAVRSTSPT